MILFFISLGTYSHKLPIFYIYRGFCCCSEVRLPIKVFHTEILYLIALSCGQRCSSVIPKMDDCIACFVFQNAVFFYPSFGTISFDKFFWLQRTHGNVALMFTLWFLVNLSRCCNVISVADESGRLADDEVPAGDSSLLFG